MDSSNVLEPHDIALDIITSVRNHPVLYLDTVKEINMDLMEFRSKVWQHISEKLNIDKNSLKGKWDNLRDTYSHILKFKNKNDAGVIRKKWIFEDALSFLAPTLNPKSQQQILELSEEYIKMITKNNITENILQHPDGQNDDDHTKKSNIVSHQERKKKTEINDKKMNNLFEEIISKYRKILPKKPAQKNSSNVISKLIMNLPVPSQIAVTKSDLVSAKTPIKRKIVEDLEETPQVECKKSKTRLQVFFADIAKMVNKLPLNVQLQVKDKICQHLEEIERKHKKEREENESILKDSESLPKMVLIPCSMIDKMNKQV